MKLLFTLLFLQSCAIGHAQDKPKHWDELFTDWRPILDSQPSDKLEAYQEKLEKLGFSVSRDFKNSGIVLTLRKEAASNEVRGFKKIRWTERAKITVVYGQDSSDPAKYNFIHSDIYLEEKAPMMGQWEPSATKLEVPSFLLPKTLSK